MKWKNIKSDYKALRDPGKGYLNLEAWLGYKMRPLEAVDLVIRWIRDLVLGFAHLMIEGSINPLNDAKSLVKFKKGGWIPKNPKLFK